MAMARRASVTVSMAAETSGMFSADAFGQARRQADIAGQNGGMGGNQQNVVEGERLLQDSHAFDPSQRRHYTDRVSHGKSRQLQALSVDRDGVSGYG